MTGNSTSSDRLVASTSPQSYGAVQSSPSSADATVVAKRGRRRASSLQSLRLLYLEFGAADSDAVPIAQESVLAGLEEGSDLEDGAQSQSSTDPLLAKSDSVDTAIESKAFVYLILQHTSSALGSGCYQFATFIFLVTTYKDTLAPASVIGLTSMLCGLIFSRRIGELVDTMPRVKFVRSAVAYLKFSQIVVYGLFLLMFGPMTDMVGPGYRFIGDHSPIVYTWTVLVLLVLFSIINYLANVGINVSIERDWVMTISQGNSERLTKLNSWMNSVDSLCKTVSAMILAILTWSLGDIGAAEFLLCASLLSWITEYYWLQVVHDAFPILKIDEDLKRRQRKEQDDTEVHASKSFQNQGLKREWAAWREFLGMPVALTTFSFAFTWLTTLHFDAVGVAYFKMTTTYSDGFIAIMRALSLLTSLMGPFINLPLERKVGPKKTGLIGLTFGIICFIFTVYGFFHDRDTKATPAQRRIYSSFMFGGIIIARAFHVTFDLAQLKLLQLDLQHHVRRNELIALQPAVCSFFAVLKFVMTWVLCTPDTFKWTTFISLCANVCAISCLAVYCRLSRGA
ncbi:hypothetical protein BD324DRAFT_648406 [Kockovaella imperatae]|uniref:Solute carrier family 40 member n=1 Tax=Kockovaella imperatae TaxID=4999 RepID=A0A1Y1UP35_9TREE|nr:hypothetical protein BD324DRAFT_648406 [Kockovaella imperatae]ORX39779.1 hypothetical protein BD324DRAFT_648406 [Kockovaella imperatae]